MCTFFKAHFQTIVNFKYFLIPEIRLQKLSTNCHSAVFSMLYPRKFYSVRKIRILGNLFYRKKFSTEVKNEKEDFGIAPSLLKKISHNFLIPSFEQDKLKKINKVTGLTIKEGSLSWAQISVPTLTLLEWNSQSKPEDFRNMNEASVLNFAYNLKQNIPISDLYVMERIGSRERSKNLNDLLLSSMLMVLLNNFDSSVQECEKVVLQKESIMNIIFNLLIGGERTSTRKVLEKFLHDVNEVQKANFSKDSSAIFYSITKINMDNLMFYDKSSLVLQESLSFVLLMTLSFIDVFIYQNAESLKKVQILLKYKKIQG